jgi:hypothetical protein
VAGRPRLLRRRRPDRPGHPEISPVPHRPAAPVPRRPARGRRRGQARRRRQDAASAGTWRQQDDRGVRRRLLHPDHHIRPAVLTTWRPGRRRHRPDEPSRGKFRLSTISSSFHLRNTLSLPRPLPVGADGRVGLCIRNGASGEPVWRKISIPSAHVLHRSCARPSCGAWGRAKACGAR